MAMKMAAKSKAAPKHKETQKTRIKQEKTSPRRTQKAKKETDVEVQDCEAPSSARKPWAISGEPFRPCSPACATSPSPRSSAQKRNKMQLKRLRTDECSIVAWLELFLVFAGV